MNNSQRCEAEIVEVGKMPSSFGSTSIQYVLVDYNLNGQWYRTGEQSEKSIKEPDKYPDSYLRYNFPEHEGKMKKGDKLTLWSNLRKSSDLHYINFNRIKLLIMITLLYGVFVVIKSIINTKRRKYRVRRMYY